MGLVVVTCSTSFLSPAVVDLCGGVGGLSRIRKVGYHKGFWYAPTGLSGRFGLTCS